MWRETFDSSLTERHITARKDGRSIKLTPDAIDREMELYPHSRTVMQLNSVTQEGLEHFISKYGKSYRSIQLAWNGGVKDLSPLGALPELEHVSLCDMRCERLWDMTGNTNLRVLNIESCKRLSARPAMLETAPALEIIWYLGGAESIHPMESLDGFANLPAVREMRLCDIRLMDTRVDFLATVPTLEVFDFEPGMFTTEEIARMAAEYPELGGRFLRAYGPAYYGAKHWVRVSGKRKPELRLPDDQEKLDKYISAYEMLVESYRHHRDS